MNRPERPFALPEDVGIRKARPCVYIFRAATAHLRSFVTSATPLNVAKSMWGDDRITELVLRAASSPAAIGQPGWSAELAQHGVRDLIASVTSVSAAADTWHGRPPSVFA